MYKKLYWFVNRVLIISYRDLLKFLNDRPRIIATFIFPLIFVGVLGNSLQASLGSRIGFNFITFTFTGVLAQTLFQSAAAGVVSLIEDRENDFSQEIFVSPISRYTIIFGKIIGESLVAIIQGIGIILFGLIIGVHMSLAIILSLIPVIIFTCVVGAAFGIIVLSNLSSQRAANQIFPFVFFPQIFLSGVFNPVNHLPWYLNILSKLSPMTYAVDLTRGVFFTGISAYKSILLFPVWIDLLLMTGIFLICLSAGTYMFVNNERNR